MCQKCEKAKEVLQEWIDKQGHDRCWYYPDLFKELINIFGIKPKADPGLPSLEEFKKGCEKYQEEEYN